MEHAGVLVDDIQIAAIVIMAGVLAYAVWRLERTLKTWKLEMREVNQQLRERLK